ncbi:MAG TPA: FtsX-like permease family protein [Streptosporangiaceae bacterium]|nr:FtsX-like permease family protein [Streptosporangiaceae bacterium]
MVAVVAGVVAALLLSAALLDSATNPWRALFAATKGADVWFRLTPGAPARPLLKLPGVTGKAGPYPATSATLADGSVQAPVQLWAMSTTLPVIGTPLVRQGRWLTASRPRGVVLEASFAQALHLSPGSVFHIDGLDGSSVPAIVVGVADTSSQGFYPDQTPGLMWVQHRLFTQVEPVSKHTDQAVGVRLASPSSAGLVAQEAAARLGGVVTGALTWQQVKQSMNGSDPLLGLLLALFGLVALGGALLAISNAAGGRVLTAGSDLAMLRTLGFTSRQLVGTLLVEHAGLAIVGTGAGVLTARLLTALLSRELPVGSLAAIAPLPAGWVLLFAAGTVTTVLLATVVSGWRAGRVWPVNDAGPPVPGGRLSRLTRAALLTRLPPAMVLGVRAAFTRLPHALLTMAGLALPVTMITIGIGFWATLNNIQHHPSQIGLAATLTVSPGSMSRQQTQQILAADPDVATTYQSVTVSALLPGDTSAITTLGVGHSSRPYPFHVVQGRLYRAASEAVASQRLLDTVHLRVGEYIRMPVGGVPVIFHIVGRIIEPEYGGQVLAYGIDTLNSAGAVPPPYSYSVVLRPGISPDEATNRLLRASGNRLDIVQAVNPATSLGIVRPMLAGLFVVLALIALTSLLTASAVGLRDHLRDVGALRAMGMTPRQVMSSLVTRTTVLALLGTAVGMVAGAKLTPHLIDVAGQAYGVGAGLGSSPSAGATLAAGGAVLIAAAAAAVIPARRAAEMPIAVTLRY